MRYAMVEYAEQPWLARVDDNAIILSADPTATLTTLIAAMMQESMNHNAFVASERKLAHADIRWLPPLQPHKNVFCVGRNYLAHAEEITRARGIELDLPDVPTFFTKAPTTIVAHEATVHLNPALSRAYDWEAELAIIIGRRCRDVSEDQALAMVFGYTCMNDISARDLQQRHVQWFKGKSLDESGPFGPWIVTADELGDPQTLHISSRVNGATKQNATTANMIFSVARIIAELSQGITLEPGDIIATGTPEGVGFARNPPEFFQDGDVVEIEIDRIGILRNKVRLIKPPTKAIVRAQDIAA